MFDPTRMVCVVLLQDLNKRSKCSKKGDGTCAKKCRTDCNTGSNAAATTPVIPVILQDAIWQTPQTLEELLHTLACTSGMNVRLVAGNTGTGKRM